LLHVAKLISKIRLVNYIMINNIEKRLEPKGDLSETVKLADLEKNIYDAEQELLRLLKDDFEKEAPKGTSFLDWLNSKDDEYFKTIKLASGGPVDNKPKEPIDVKKIDLNAELLKTADMFSKLSLAERESISFMLKKLLNPKK